MRVEHGFKFVVRDDCPPDKIYIMDPSALGIDEEARIVVCPDEPTKESLEEAMRRFGRIDLP